MPIRGSVDSTFTVRAFNIVRGALAASGVASNQPAWRYFSTPWSTLFQTGVPSARGRLQSK